MGTSRTSQSLLQFIRILRLDVIEGIKGTFSLFPVVRVLGKLPMGFTNDGSFRGEDDERTEISTDKPSRIVWLCLRSEAVYVLPSIAIPRCTRVFHGGLLQAHPLRLASDQKHATG